VKSCTGVLLMLLAGTAAAGQLDDYAQSWPLQLGEADSGAYRVMLDEAVYRAARDMQLADIEVFNGNGQAVPATLAAVADTTAEWRWLALDGTPQQDGAQVFYLYTLAARIPARQLDVRRAGDNDVAEWTVSSREPAQQRWTSRAGPWTGYRVAAQGSVEKSAPQPLSGQVRDRYWRVTARPASGAPPRLLLGYRPESLLFLAQGPGPYTLAAGSATARRSEAPMNTLLDALRRRHGSQWQPAAAVPGPGRVLRELPPLPVAEPSGSTDWRSILLWAVLLGGALIVAGMAAWLLRDQSGGERGG
jgi:Protein of unknown function (DUF3999)